MGIMDKKIENYRNYVVQDLIKKTQIDNSTGKITMTFSNSYFHDVIPYYLSKQKRFAPDFIKFVTEIYGAREEDINPIWSQYQFAINEIMIEKERDT
jgi:hypothetical protein